MLGKLSLKPSLLLEVAFMLAVWLITWLVFRASLTVIIIVIFGAYGIVFLYENWIDGLAKRKRSELRRSEREAASKSAWAEPPRQTPPPSDAGVSKARAAEPGVSTQPVLESPVTDALESDVEREAELPPEVIAAEAARAREQAEQERAEKERAAQEQAERERVERERTEKESAAQEQAERERVERERTQSAQTKREAGEPAEPEPAPEPEAPQERRSLMAAIAAAPGETLRTHAVGGWNLWQLERMMTARLQRDEERDYERSLLLVYLRDFADSDGQLPPEFDELVSESFGDLVRGPATP